MRRTVSLPPPDGSDQFEKIQNILQDGNVILELPPGVFHISETLRVFSDTTICATPQTVIRRMDHSMLNYNDCVLANADEYDKGNRNIEIDGGIWNANNAENPRGKTPGSPTDSYGGWGLRFNRVENLKIQNLTVANAESYFIRMCNIRNFEILNVSFYSTCFRNNQDGVHLNGYCFHGKIKGLYGISPYTPGDDMIALNAYDGTGGILNHGVTLGPIEDIEIEDVEANSVYGFVRILTKDHPVKNVTFRNIRGGVRYLLLNANMFGEATPGCGLIENVDFSDIHVYKAPQWSDSDIYNDHSLFGLQLKMKNVTFRNVKRPMLDTGHEKNTFHLHPLAGKVEEYIPDPCNTAKDLVTEEDGTVLLKYGGFEFLKISSP